MRSPFRRPIRRASRGVSDVIATILLLALTVTLFSSIFFFVNTFPTPPPQPTDQFSATLTYTTTGSTTNIVGITILHLAGPSVVGSSLVYLYSSAQPNKFTVPFTVSSGVGGGQVWNLGQSWTKNITSYALKTPDNITVSVVTNSALLFRITLPGVSPNVPPVFANIATNPSNPQVGKGFQILAQIVDPALKASSVFVNLSQFPGIVGSGLFKMTFVTANGTWQYNVPTGTISSTGTFYAFINASDNFGLKNSVAFTITIGATLGALTATLSASPSAPVAGTAVNLTASVTNGASNGGTSGTLTFTANAVTIGSTTGAIAGGSVSSFVEAWTPATPGVYFLAVVVNATGGVTTAATLNITVYPSILLLSHNVAAGTRTTTNESAYLAEELTAAGYPFQTKFVPCATSIPAGTFTGFTVVVIDFGSNTGGGCPTAASSTDQSTITGTASTSFVVVGSNAFATTTCATYSAAYFTDFGLTTPGASGTCQTDGAAAAAVTYSSAPASGLRSDGIPASLTWNLTIGGSSTFIPYDTFGKGATNSFLKVGGAANGAYRVSGSTRWVAIAADPSMLRTTLPAPASASWGTGGAGTDLMYNVMGFATGLATSSATGRALTDFAISQVTIVGQSHTLFSKIYVALRANGPVGAGVTATLFENGSVALNGGSVVLATVSIAGGGTSTYVVLTWLAPSSGPYTLSVILTSDTADLWAPDNYLPTNLLNQATVFT